jgi:hypothetical protein
MATLSLNSTGRSRITLDMFDAALESQDSDPTIKIEWDMSSLMLEPLTKLYLDASNDRLERRFQLADSNPTSGTANVDLGPSFSGRVTRIRLVAVLVDTSGVPIIRAESIPVSFTTTGDSTSKSLLVVQPDVDLPVPWRLNFDSGDVVMMVSNKNDLWTLHLRNSPVFKPLLVGPVVFQIAVRLLSGSEDVGAGLEQWEKLLEQHGLDNKSAEGATFDEILELAEHVSLSFQAKTSSLDRLVKELEEAVK